jgi:uncharacterized protein YbjT (DUF2867 family)
MTLRIRLILAIGAVALLMVVPALYAALQLSRLRDIAADVSITHGAAYLAMGSFQTQLIEADRLARAYVAFGEQDIAARRDAALARPGRSCSGWVGPAMATWRAGRTRRSSSSRASSAPSMSS